MRSARLLLALALGCHPFNLGPSDIVGVYTLVSVSGDPLPHTGPLGDVTFSVTGGTLTLEGDGTGRLLTQYADQPEPSAADVEWVLHGGLIDFTFRAGGVADLHPNVTWDDGSLRIAHSGVDDLLPGGIYLYQRGAVVGE